MTASRYRIVSLTETNSTNADALRLALNGETLPLWVSAESQTAGRGRSGRLWTSQPGNLLASLAIVSDAPLKSAGELSLLAGIAVIDAVRSISPLAETIGLRLKWPNDVLIGSAKAGGILVETTIARGEAGVKGGFLAVIGFGLNVATCPGGLGRATGSLAGSGIVVSRDDMLAALADQCDAWLARWDNGRNFSAVRQAWMERAGAIGEAITLHTATGLVAATYQGLAESGALLADTGGHIETITYGDVFLIAPTEQSSGQ